MVSGYKNGDWFKKRFHTTNDYKTKQFCKLMWI